MGLFYVNLIMDVWKKIDSLTGEYLDLRLDQVIDYERFNLYSIVHHSTSIEGSTLTQLDTELLLSEGITAKGKPLEHHLMVQDHFKALSFVLENAEKKTLITPELIQAIASFVMERTGGIVRSIGGDFDTAKGDWRLANVSAGSTRFVDFTKVKSLVAKLCDALQTKVKSVKNMQEILSLSFDAHYDLVQIHPFGDGNGRASRLLMNFIQRYHGQPLTIVYTEDKADYINSLNESRKKEDLTFFREFMCAQHIKFLEWEIRKSKELKNDPGKGYSMVF